MISRITRFIIYPFTKTGQKVVYGIKLLIGSVKQRRGSGIPQNPEEQALDDYQRRLEKTFGSSRILNSVMSDVRSWVTGE